MQPCKRLEVMEDIDDQIVRKDLLKKDNISKYHVLTALKSFTYPYLYLGFKNFRVDQNRIMVLHFLQEIIGIKT